MQTEAAQALFRSLADPTRRGIFERLAHEGELSVSELTRRAAVSQPAVSQHLRALRASGLVQEEKRGRQVLYRARPEGLRPLADWMAAYAAFWSQSLDRLEAILEEMDDDERR